MTDDPTDPQWVDLDDDYCPGRQDEIHCYHWWDGRPCCSCEAPGQPICPGCENPPNQHVTDCPEVK